MTQQNDKKLELHLKRDNLKATCKYNTENGYTLLAGSQIVLKLEKPISKRLQALRDELIASGGLIADTQKKCYVLQRDWTFTWPSQAACFVIGKSCNGYNQWCDNNGVSLDALCKELGIKRFKRNGHK